MTDSSLKSLPQEPPDFVWPEIVGFADDPISRFARWLRWDADGIQAGNLKPGETRARLIVAPSGAIASLIGTGSITIAAETTDIQKGATLNLQGGGDLTSKTKVSLEIGCLLQNKGNRRHFCSRSLQMQTITNWILSYFHVHSSSLMTLLMR